MKYQWIRQHREAFSVTVMCDVLKVSDSGYYGWLKRKPSRRFQRTQKIHEDVRSTFEQNGGIYGARKIVEAIEQQDQLQSVCRNTVSKAMREMGLHSCVAKKFKPVTTQANPAKIPAPNVLNQDFQADAPNRKWVTDITYLPTDDGWVYLAVVLDLFSRKIVGWAIDTSLATDLVADALRQAIESRQPGPGLIHVNVVPKVQRPSVG
jgi:putative transposase